FEFIADQHTHIKTFLKKHGVSKGRLAKIQYTGGNIWVNDIEQNAPYLLGIGDRVTIDIQAEEDLTGSLEPIFFPLDIV
ncbi:RluA family pseudouridine synthase, partial [Streptococcus suis]